ncbi:Glycerol-3-phosphate acyltransferase [Chitinispirillum alkaliphilum]|nr:Glycerol-3-phosphate acyltransferase [Chitinispirillum alkaliphilum]
MKDYHKSVMSVSESVARFFDTVFSRVHIDGPDLDAERIQKNPLMIVSTHRSHIDYFFVGKMMYFKGFTNLRFAAGDNLTKLPIIGPRFRNFGAFTVSRGKGFLRNYVRKLCNDVITMMKGGDIVLVFPEGGRSYTGNTLEIRGGILNSAILLQARNPDLDVRILPMSISYECAPDVPWFPMLLKGKRLREKTNPLPKRLLGNIYYYGADLMAFIPIFFYRLFRRNYGEIYSDYQEPVCVKELVDIEKNKNSDAKDEFFAHRESLDQLSEKVFERFVSLYRILPLHLVAKGLSGVEKGSTIDIDLVEKSVLRFRDQAVRENLNVKSVVDLTAPEIVKRGFEQLEKYKAIKRGKTFCRMKNPEIIKYCAAALKIPGEEKLT